MIEYVKGFPKNRTKIGACQLKKEKNIKMREKTKPVRFSDRLW
jgi:hypothetical protein